MLPWLKGKKMFEMFQIKGYIFSKGKTTKDERYKII
jgi:hypothetical protein